MSLYLITFVSMIIGINAQPRSDNLESFAIDYFGTRTNGSYDEDCNLSLELYVDGITSLDINLKQSLLYWTHLRLYQLIESSFIYETDKYTSNLWNEYYLTILNQTKHDNKTIITMSICVSENQFQFEIKHIIQTELQTDGDEVAAFVKYKWNEYLNKTIYNIDIDLVLISMTSTTANTISMEYRAHKTGSKMIYVIIIGICMIIMGLVMIAICIDNKVKNAIKDIRSLANVRHKFRTQNAKKVYSESTLIHTMNVHTNPRPRDRETTSSLPSDIATPDIPSTPDIFNEPLPVHMRDPPPSETVSIPPKDSFRLTSKPSFKLSASSVSAVSIRYDYNGNIKHKYSIDIMPLEEKYTARNSNDNAGYEQQQHNIVCYDDNDELGIFKLVHDDELGDTLFSDIIID